MDQTLPLEVRKAALSLLNSQALRTVMQYRLKELEAEILSCSTGDEADTAIHERMVLRELLEWMKQIAEPLRESTENEA